MGTTLTEFIFVRYDELSLKLKTRANRAGGIQTQCKVEDDTFISNLKTKEILSSFTSVKKLKNKTATTLYSIATYVKLISVILIMI